MPRLSASALVCWVIVSITGCGRSTVFESFSESSTGSIGGGRTGGSAGSGTSASASAGGTSGASGSGISGTGAGTNGQSGGESNSNGTGTAGGGSIGSTSAGQGSGSSGSTLGSTGTGGTSGSCSQEGGQAELGPCLTAQDCACPLECVAEAGGALCEAPCETLDDCLMLDTACSGETCRPIFCGPQAVAGPQNGELDGTCNAIGQGDGSCLPSILNGQKVGLCSQGGPAQTNCDPDATRSDLSQACVAGDVCLSQSGGGQCFTLCDPIAPAPCSPGMACQIPVATNPRLGVCEPSQGTTGGTGGSGTGGATGGTGGGTTGGTTGNCDPSIQSSEFQNCSTAGCGCPLTCVNDPVRGAPVCEYPCMPGSGCSDPQTSCDVDAGACGFNSCGPEDFNSVCDATGTDDGTCVPETFDGVTSVGICIQGGTATTSCNPEGTRTDPAQLCTPGSWCIGVGPVGECNLLCDPGTGIGCPFDQFCTAIVDEPDLGICIGGD
jgi:hypothetical protein